MNQNEINWEDSGLTAIIEHLLQHHHPYTKSALQRLSPVMENVLHAHGEAHPELRELAPLFYRLKDDMDQHLMKEEIILFPYFRILDAEANPPRPGFGTVENPIRMMTVEHHNDGLILHQMLTVTHNFTLPNNACASFTDLYQGLHELVKDLFQHIYLENNILFVKAIALEKAKLGQS